MIEGYGFSIWYIPINYKELQKIYNIQHIPHITYQSNFETFNDAEQVYQKINPIINVEFISKIIFFPQMYQNDPLLGCGFYVEKSQYLNPTFDPHLTTKYFIPNKELNKNIKTEIDKYLQSVNSFKIPKSITCFKAISDNRILDANNWKIIKYNLNESNH